MMKRFAPIGLYIALLAVVVSAGLFIVQKQFNLPLQISLGMIVIGLAIFVILDPQKTIEFFKGRQAKYGSNALILILAVLGIVVVANYLINNNSKRWDLTEDKQHTLAPETLNIISKLPTTVTVEGFFSAQYSSDTAKKLLEDYRYNSKGKFAYQFIDPNANPIAAQNAKVTKDGTLVFSMQGRTEQVTDISEQNITSTLIRLSNPGERKVYFLIGHGEFDISGSDDTAFSDVKAALDAKNYTVNTLNLLAGQNIPNGALAIIIAGGTKPLDSKEVDLLKAYLDKGGALVLLSEPPALTNYGTNADPLADYLTKSWYVQLQNDVVIDPSVNPPLITAGSPVSRHPITANATMASIFPTSHTITLVRGAPTEISQVELISTSTSAWGETDIQSIKDNKVTADQTVDHIGPASIAFALSNSTTKARMVVVGDADFATNKYFFQYGNSDLIINAIDWSAQQDNLINLTVRQTTTRFLLPPGQLTLGLLLLGTIFVLPGIVLLSGIVVWVQRRRRG